MIKKNQSIIKKQLYGEIIKNYNFSEQPLADLFFEDCLFDSCKFSGVKLENCRFIDCTFCNCDLSLVVVKNARFDNVEFNECKIVGVNWYELGENRIMGNQLIFHKCILNSSSFSGLEMQQSKLMDCKLYDVDFTDTNCEGSDFSYSDCLNARFHKTNLSACNFCFASNYNINLYTNIVDRTKFSSDEALNLLASSGLIVSDD